MCLRNSRSIMLLSLYCCLCCLLLLACAVPYSYSYPGHKTFTHDNIELLRVGMSSSEILRIFGEPDEQYVSTFGADVGEEWSGRVWIYFTKLDTRLQYAKRYQKNMFVFYPSEGDMKLNHWEIEALK